MNRAEEYEFIVEIENLDDVTLTKYVNAVLDEARDNYFDRRMSNTRTLKVCGYSDRPFLLDCEHATDKIRITVYGQHPIVGVEFLRKAMAKVEFVWGTAKCKVNFPNNHLIVDDGLNYACYAMYQRDVEQEIREVIFQKPMSKKAAIKPFVYY